MNRSEPQDLYNNTWDMDFTNIEDLFARIKALASLGAYEMCVYIDSNSTYNEVHDILVKAGYDVEDHNGGNNATLSISWG